MVNISESRGDCPGPAESDVGAAAELIRSQWSVPPRAAIVLGTGLGEYTRQMATELEISFEQLPGFKTATAIGHAGRVVCGRVAGVPVIAIDGRNHRYEGCSMRQLAFPVQVLKQLGVELLVLSNASGGIHPRLRQGDVLILEDHINLMESRPKFPTSSLRSGHGQRVATLYDRSLIEQAKRIARLNGFDAQLGVYAAVTGPNYETRAEYRFLRRIGADAVGMSTVPEVLTANHLGMRVLAVSAVTNVCRPDDLRATDGQAVIDAARSTEPKIRAIVTAIASSI